MIAVEGVKKTYAGRIALDGISFEVERGRIVGLLGRNGAGKTTTLRILAGVTRPTAGRVVIDGLDDVHAKPSLRAQLGYLPETAPLYPELRVEEHLMFRAAQKGIGGSSRRECVARALASVGATELRGVIGAHLSRGMRQRVGLADAILTRPKLLLLDEPTTGLDPNQTRETRDLIRNLAPACTVIVSTHILSEVEALCDSAVLIDRGRVAAHGTLMELHGLGCNTELVMTLRTNVERASEVLSSLDAPLAIEQLEGELVRVVVTCQSDASIDDIAERASKLVSDHGIPLRQVGRKAASLEGIFAELTREEKPPP